MTIVLCVRAHMALCVCVCEANARISDLHNLCPYEADAIGRDKMGRDGVCVCVFTYIYIYIDTHTG